jgi:hypothetical protein
MNGENEVHKRHVKIVIKGKTNHSSKTFWSKQKPFVDLNDHLKYNINTNVATWKIGTKLIRLLSLTKFG